VVVAAAAAAAVAGGAAAAGGSGGRVLLDNMHVDDEVHLYPVNGVVVFSYLCSACISIFFLIGLHSSWLLLLLLLQVVQQLQQVAVAGAS
jgi:hypothetical protein